MIETRLTTAQYQQCQILARDRAKKAKSKKFSAWTDAETHFIGLVGEFAFASVTGLKVDTRWRWGGDGHVDFKVKRNTIQVKTRNTNTWGDPDLLVRPSVAKCKTYVLCEWKSSMPQIVVLVGWCTHGELIKERRDLGYGEMYYMPRRKLSDIDVLVQSIRETMGTRR